MKAANGCSFRSKAATKKMKISGVKVREKRDALKLSKEVFAEKIGVVANTIYAWEHGATINITKYGDQICAALQVELDDILEDPPAPGQVVAGNQIRNPQLQYKIQQVEKEIARPLDFSLPEAMRMVTDVLTSRTSYATALYLNIQHFDRAIRAENRIGILEDENKRLNSKISDLEGRLTALEKLSKGVQAGGPAADPETATPLLNGTTGT